jgi:hypothetical protein
MYEYACAHILWFPFSVSLGWFHDDARAEPRSWLVMGMIPVFDSDKKKAVRAGRPEDGPKSAARRRIRITHQVCADRDYLPLLSNKNQIVVEKHCSGWKQAPVPSVPRTCCLRCSTVTHAGKIASWRWHQHHSTKHAWLQQCFGKCSLAYMLQTRRQLPVLRKNQGHDLVSWLAKASW